MRRKTILASLFGLVVLAIAAAWFVFVGLNATRYLLFARADARSRDEIEAMLKRIHLPEGFSIALYAQAPGARSLAVGAKGEAIFVGTADDRVHVLTPGDGRAASVDVLAPEMKFVMPHGVCFSREGVLFVVERNKITRFDEAEIELAAGGVAGARHRPGGRPHPARRAERQPLRARLPRGAGRQTLCVARPALQCHAAREARAL